MEIIYARKTNPAINSFEDGTETVESTEEDQQGDQTGTADEPSVTPVDEGPPADDPTNPSTSETTLDEGETNNNDSGDASFDESDSLAVDEDQELDGDDFDVESEASGSVSAPTTEELDTSTQGVPPADTSTATEDPNPNSTLLRSPQKFVEVIQSADELYEKVGYMNTALSHQMMDPVLI